MPSQELQETCFLLLAFTGTSQHALTLTLPPSSPSATSQMDASSGISIHIRHHQGLHVLEVVEQRFPRSAPQITSSIGHWWRFTGREIDSYVLFLTSTVSHPPLSGNRFKKHGQSTHSNGNQANRILLWQSSQAGSAARKTEAKTGPGLKAWFLST